jgi:TDG/mug DNA glycosylase family protein
MAARVWHDGVLTLEDLLAPDLDVLFVGYNPHPYAVEQGHYYARRANRFWEDLHEAGLVPRVLRGPDEDRELLRYGLGVTDLIKRPTRGIDELTARDFAAGFERLTGLLEAWRPQVVCFNGIGLHERFGRQGRSPEGVAVTFVPSTSPRNMALRHERLAAFRRLKERVDALRQDRSNSTM